MIALNRRLEKHIAASLCEEKICIYSLQAKARVIARTVPLARIISNNFCSKFSVVHQTVDGLMKKTYKGTIILLCFSVLSNRSYFRVIWTNRVIFQDTVWIIHRPSKDTGASMHAETWGTSTLMITDITASIDRRCLIIVREILIQLGFELEIGSIQVLLTMVIYLFYWCCR